MKHAATIDKMTDRLTFPGRHAGASLKPLPGTRGGCVLPLIPRQTCRGLIEAWTGAATRAGSRRHSPADMPGPH